MAETVRNPASEVFAEWAKAIKPVVGEGNYASDNSTVIAKTPFARLYMMGNPSGAMDLEGNECSTLPAFQSESFASGQTAINDVYAIDDVSHKAMISMGFKRTFGPELIANMDSRIKRCVSRYSRVFAADDVF